MGFIPDIQLSCNNLLQIFKKHGFSYVLVVAKWNGFIIMEGNRKGVGKMMVNPLRHTSYHMYH
jgi:hypothetical protein